MSQRANNKIVIKWANTNTHSETSEKSGKKNFWKKPIRAKKIDEIN